jgi:hypothetical protein
MRAHRYQITIMGSLGPVAQEMFEDFKIESNRRHTYLIADLDQAGLYGALNRIQSIGLELIELTRMAGPGPA